MVANKGVLDVKKLHARASLLSLHLPSSQCPPQQGFLSSVSSKFFFLVVFFCSVACAQEQAASIASSQSQDVLKEDEFDRKRGRFDGFSDAEDEDYDPYYQRGSRFFLYLLFGSFFGFLFFLPLSLSCLQERPLVEMW